MLVDGENSMGTLHTDTVYNLCTRINYVYSAWITNVLRPTSCGGPPKLTSLTSPATTILTPTVYSVCEGQPVYFSATGDGSFLWKPSTGLSNPDIPNPVSIAHDTMEYKVVVTNSFGCKDSALVLVNVFRNPKAICRER